MEGEAWHAAVHVVAKSRTRLSDGTETDSSFHGPLFILGGRNYNLKKKKISTLHH